MNRQPNKPMAQREQEINDAISLLVANGYRVTPGENSPKWLTTEQLWRRHAPHLKYRTLHKRVCKANPERRKLGRKGCQTTEVLVTDWLIEIVSEPLHAGSSHPIK